MKRIVLYAPAQEDPDLGIPTSAHLLPLSLLTIAAWPLRDGFEVVIIDASLHSIEEAQSMVLEACETAMLFGTTGILGYAITDGFHMTSLVKQRFPELPCVLGGWFANAMPELQLATGLYAALVIGQGELTFRELVQAIDQKRDIDGIEGLALWREGKVVTTAPRKVVGWEQLRDVPWDLVDWEARKKRMLDPQNVLPREIMPSPPGTLTRGAFTAIAYHSSFGCPLDCTFCCSPNMTLRRWKAMGAARMLDDIESLWKRWKFDSVHFYDANWGVAEKRVREFAQGLIERGIRIHYYAYLQSSSICGYSQDTLDLLARSGLYGAVIGAETASEETMKLLHKPTSNEQNMRATHELDRRGIAVFASYLIGFPGESEESMLQTIDQCRRMAVAAPLATPSLWEYQPIPGAAMYAEALKQGWQAPQTLAEWGAFFDYRDLASGFVSAKVARMKRLYLHFSNIMSGVQRGRRGYFERHAHRRLGSERDFAAGWPGGLWEARAFHIAHLIERRLPGWMRPREEGIEKDWKTRTGIDKGRGAAGVALVRSYRARRRGRRREQASLDYYERLERETQRDGPMFLNFGYADLDQDARGLTLEPADEPQRYHLQLYDHLLQLVELRNKSLLEVGCGQGGGCRYVEGYLGASSVVGLDHSPQNIASAERCSGDAIQFKRGSAANLPFADASFDVVLCVEATHDFANVDQFLSEAHRTLRKGGELLLTDFRWRGEEAILWRALGESDFRIERQWDVSEQVLAAIRADDARRRAWLRSITKTEEQFQWLATVAMLCGTERHAAFERGEMRYVSCLCTK